MISGIVYFSEIIEQVKNLTGYVNIQPYISMLKRYVFLAERDIGYGGMVTKKSKDYIAGDGYLASDSKSLVLPPDFMEASLLGDMENVSIEVNGNIATLNWDGTPPSTVTLNYMGVITDDDGNPITTRNHFEAVVNYCIWKLYSPRVFLGQQGANRGLLRDYKYDYEQSALASRGNDVMLSEEDWDELGSIMRTSRFDLLVQDSYVLVQTQ